MKRIFNIFALCLFSAGCLLLCGCSVQKEIGNQAVITGLYLDYSLPAQQFEIAAEIADFKGYEKNSSLSTKWVSAGGQTLSEALFRLQKNVPQTIYFSHAKILILGPGFQAVSPQHTISFFLNYNGINSDILLCTSNANKEELTSIKTQNFSTEIYDALQLGNRKSSQLYRLFNSQKNFWLLPEISISENKACKISTSLFIHGAYAKTLQNSQELIYLLFTQGIQNQHYSTENFDLFIKEGKSAVQDDQNRLLITCRLMAEISDTHGIIHDEQLTRGAENQLKQKLTAQAVSFYNELKEDGKIKLFFNETYSQEPEFQFDITIMKSQFQKEESDS